MSNDTRRAGIEAPAGQPILFTDPNARASGARGDKHYPGNDVATQEAGGDYPRSRPREPRRYSGVARGLLRTEPAVNRRVLAERLGITLDGVKYT